MMTSRAARPEDVDSLQPLVDAAIDVLQQGYLSDEQIEASRSVMGIDRQLIEDGTYFIVEIDGRLAGCGGWSRRETKYGGDHSPGRDARLLDPATEPARIRAMYTHPAFVRRGVGSLIMRVSEDAARSEGFRDVELYATLAGLQFYRSVGFEELEELPDATDGSAAPVPAVRMRKHLAP